MALTTTLPYDLVLNSESSAPIGLMLYRDTNRPKRYDGTYMPAIEGDALRHRDVPVTWDDFSLGFGYSRRWGQRGGYAYGLGIDARYPRAVIPAGALTDTGFPTTLGGVTDSFELNNHLYCVTGTGYVIKYTNKIGTPTVETYLGALSLNSAVVFNGSAYVGGVNGAGTPQNLRRLSGSTWSELAGVPGNRLATVTWYTADNIPSFRLLRTDTAHSLTQCSADPSVPGNWAASIPIGNQTYPIQTLVGSPRHVYALRPDGLYDITAFGESPNLTPYWGDVTDSLSGQTGVIANDYLIAAHAMGLDAVPLNGQRQDAPNWCQPGYLLPNETPIQGRVTALTTESGWVIAAVYNVATSTSYVMYGKPRTDPGVPNGPGPFLWHGAMASVTGYVTHMTVVSPSSGPALLYLFSVDGSTVRGHTVSLPRAATPLGDWLSGGTHRFQESARLYFPVEDWENDTARKYLWRYELTADNLGTGRGLDLYAQLDDAAWIRQTTMTGGPRLAANAVSGGAAYHVGHYVQLRSSSTQPVILRALTARAEMAVEQTDVRSYTVLFGGGIALRNGSPDLRDPLVVWAQVLNLMQAAPITMVDQFGRVLTVRVLQGLSYQAIEERADQWYLRADITVRVLAVQGRYDQGHVYDGETMYT